MTYRQTMRVLRLQRVWLVIEYYSMFAQRQMNHTLLSTKKDYVSAEKMADMLSFMTKERISPEDFMPSKDELNESILHCHDVMEEIVELGKQIGIEREELDAFAREVYYTFKHQPLKIYHIQLCYIVGSFANYIAGGLKVSELRTAIKFPASPFSKIPLKKSFIRKCFMDVEKGFKEISDKRALRELKLILAPQEFDY